MLAAYDRRTKKPVHGLNLGEYVGPKSKDVGGQFNCNATICYPIGANIEDAFAELQRQVNRFAKIAAYAPVTVDSFIGDRTVIAVKKAVTYVQLSRPVITTPLPELSDSILSAIENARADRRGREIIAQWAEEIASFLSSAGNALNLPSAAGEIVRYTPREPQVPASIPMQPVKFDSIRTAGFAGIGTKWWVLILGLSAAGVGAWWFLGRKDAQKMEEF